MEALGSTFSRRLANGTAKSLRDEGKNQSI